MEVLIPRRWPVLLVSILVTALLLPSEAEARRKRKGGRKRGPSVAATKKVPPDRDLTTAQHRRDRGEFETSLELVLALLVRQPDNFGAHRLYQELAARTRGAPWPVVAEYGHLVATKPESARSHALYAAALLQAARWPAGVGATPTAELPPQVREGIERHLAIARADRRWAPAAALLDAELRSGAPRAAATEIEVAFGLAPDDPVVRVAWLDSRCRTGDLARVGPLGSELLAQQPWRADALIPWLTGACAATLPDVDARLWLDRLPVIQNERSRDAATLEAILRIYEALGDTRRAEDCRTTLRIADVRWAPRRVGDPFVPKEGAALRPADLEIAESLARLANGVEDPSEALATLDRWVASASLAPSVLAEVHRLRAEILRGPGMSDFDAGRAALEAARAADPGNPLHDNAWAYACAVDGVDLAEALAAVEAALESLLGHRVDPLEWPWQGEAPVLEARRSTVGALVDTRGWLLHRLGRNDDALPVLELATLLVDDGTVWGHLGRVLLALGQREAALTALVRALAAGTEDEADVRAAATHLYERLHAVRGGLDALIAFEAQDAGADVAESGSEPNDPAAGADERAPSGAEPAGGTTSAPEPGPTVGGLAPSLRGEGPAGATDLGALRGQVVVIEFWASWCSPCLEAMPRVLALAAALATEGVILIAASVDEDDAAFRTIVDALPKHDARFLRVGGEVATAWNLAAIPTTVVIGRDGRIDTLHEGIGPSSTAEIVARVVELLDPGAEPAAQIPQ